MQTVTGRLTADAVVKRLNDGREVVNFSIADNQSYKTKGGEQVDATTYFNCSFWLSTGVSKILRKGAVVQLSGRTQTRIYTTNTGDPGASLNFITNRIDVLAYASGKAANSARNNEEAALPAGNEQEIVDDLPF